MTIQEIREKLMDKSVGIAGCGGLGSNCAVALARVGIGRLVLADFDVVDEANLNRQYFFLDQLGQKKVTALKQTIHRIDTGIEVETHDLILNGTMIEKIFRNCDVLVEAFDLAEMKEMIIETVLDKFPEKPLVCGIGLAGWGKNNELRMRKLGNLYICGDESSETSDHNPPLAPRVGIVAGMEANQVLEILLNEQKDNGNNA